MPAAYLLGPALAPDRSPHFTGCGKATFATPRLAYAVAHRRNITRDGAHRHRPRTSTRMLCRVYRCPTCAGWHLRSVGAR